MRILSLILFICIFFVAIGQEISNKCECYSFINWENVNKNTFNGQKNLKKLYKTEIPCENDLYKILKDSSEYFLIKRDDCIINKLDTFGISCQVLWIKKQNIFCSYSRTYNEKSFTIYSLPNINSKKIFNRKLKDNEFNSLMIFKNCFNNWIKVRVKFSGVEYEGWINEKYSCPLHCTTCT